MITKAFPHQARSRLHQRRQQQAIQATAMPPTIRRANPMLPRILALHAAR